MFRIVFWDILPCKMIVDRRFRGAYCLHHPWWCTFGTLWSCGTLSSDARCLRGSCWTDRVLFVQCHIVVHVRFQNVMPKLQGLFCIRGCLNTWQPEYNTAMTWWRQYAPLKRRSTIILHGSISQKTILNIILAAMKLKISHFKASSLKCFISTITYWISVTWLNWKRIYAWKRSTTIHEFNHAILFIPLRFRPWTKKIFKEN
jgi:hypothetical protein